MNKNKSAEETDDYPLIKKIRTDRVIDLVGKLKSLKSSEINASSFIVFKVSSKLNDHLIHDKNDCEQVYNRAHSKPFYTLVFDFNDGNYKLFRIERDSGVLQLDESLLHVIRQQDLIEVIENQDTRCIHNPPESTHFKTPSGFHTKSFLRLADAIHSYNALDRISFWLQEHMITADAVLVDNWSLSSIVLQGQILLSKEVPFDCLSDHIDYDLENAKIKLQKLINQVEAGSTILVVVSVRASGNFSMKLLELCQSLFPAYDFNLVSIYQLPCEEGYSEDSLCRIINDSLRFFPEEECPNCQEGEKTHLIDSKYYYPRADDERKVKLIAKYLNSEENKEIRESLDKMAKIDGAYCVHRNDPNDGITPRHHAYYIDVCKLIENDGFMDKFGGLLKSISSLAGPTPDVIICPPHDAGHSLAERARQSYGCQVIATHDMKLDDAEKKMVKAARHICIIDDVLISGSRLDTFNRALRETIKPDSLGRVTYLIAVCRPESENKLKSIRDGLVVKHDWEAEIYSVFKVYLPAWQENECPWCKETKIWDQIESPFDPPEYYSSRIQQLNSRSNTGITKRPFARLNDFGDCVLGSSSPMAASGASEMVALFNIAVALQMMRNDPNESQRLERMLYSNNALDGGSDGNFKRFSEPLIQACLIKNTKPKEWSSDVVTSGINSLILKIPNDGTRILLLELLFFILRHSPKEALDLSKLEEALDSCTDDDDLVKDLVSLV